MKKLLAVTAIAVSMGLSSLSFADTNVFGVQTPITKNEVSDQVKGGYVETDHISFYLNARDSVDSVENATHADSKDNSYSVFGVEINV
ncbi:MAG: hypothetical protein GWO07_11965 [Candidatus Dadabacteria bacterium]|nr:hypothetical protein [Candidatus Dadabacteria bacterium]NIS09454.1 hypothetical protein [Candidatus Dadabacteria bacterium]NIV42767.1 hypothetical protein [Candidatus Dadabacteria bacterium]NIX15971.1 hypothetical protein [Candidatus Dadabacteria bacterium]NIY22704.1 hypothetical protein [Candidatus Dadabacteria bacterium]